MEYDVFREQIVARPISIRGRMAQAGIIVLGVALVLVAAFIPNMLMWAPVIVVGVFFSVMLLVRRQHIEFEFSLNSGVLSVDKIIAKSSRRHMVDVELKSLESFGIEGRDARELSRMCDSICDCTAGTGDVYAAVYMAGGDVGRTILLFEPNDKMKAALSRVISPRVWKYEG